MPGRIPAAPGNARERACSAVPCPMNAERHSNDLCYAYRLESRTNTKPNTGCEAPRERASNTRPCPTNAERHSPGVCHTCRLESRANAKPNTGCEAPLYQRPTHGRVRPGCNGTVPLAIKDDYRCHPGPDRTTPQNRPQGRLRPFPGAAGPRPVVHGGLGTRELPLSSQPQESVIPVYGDPARAVPLLHVC
jgi:hypothetical protein